MKTHRVALVVLVDIEDEDGDCRDPENWAEHGLRYALGGARLGLPARLHLPGGYHLAATAVSVHSVRGAIQNGLLEIVAVQPRQPTTQGD